MGPTGGFLVGFLAAAGLLGALAERGWTATPLRLVVAMALGHVAIFAFGFAWLAGAIGADRAWALGVAPFFAATLIKTGLAAALIGALGRACAGKRGSGA